MHSMGDDSSYMTLPSAQKFLSVKKSMNTLNDAVCTPGPYLRELRRVDFTPSSLPSHSMFGVSDTPGASFLFTPSNKGTPGGSTLLATPGSTLRYSILGQTINEEVTSVSNAEQMLTEDPVVTARQAICSDFAESYSLALTRHEVFEPVARYERICQDSSLLFKKLATRTVPSHKGSASSRTLELGTCLNVEQQTWRLVSSLYRDRIETENQLAAAPDGNVALLDESVKQTSEKKLIDTLFDRDSALRQAQLVVDWLEYCSGDVFENFYNKVDYLIDKTGAWENTLHMLKQQKEFVGSRAVASHTFVDQLDPDAPLRQRKQLLDLDVEDDVRLLEYVFVCLRAGQHEEAHRVCMKVGQMWRAATLNGWRLFHDPNFEQLGPGGTIQRVEGNRYRDVWKKTCWKTSEDDRLPAIERAVYASLCGNLRQLLPCLSSWHDYLWGYFKTMVDQLVETHIRTSFSGPRRFVALPSNYADDVFTAKRIFSEIEACANERIQRQCNDHFNVIQKYIITNDVSGLVEEMYEWCRDETNRPNEHLLRFMAHLVLFFKSIGFTSKEELCTAVLESYVRLLIDNRRIELVATYVATLPRNLQVEWYARFLGGVTDSDERRHCLELAERRGLDVLRTTKLVVENIRHVGAASDVAAGSDFPLEATTTPDDVLKIEALEWLIFNPVQRSEALRQANAVMRVFLASRKLQACREAARKIPHGSYDIMLHNWHAQTGETELSAQDMNAYREFLCIQAFLDAHESFSDWFAHCHQARPKRPDIGLAANFSERVAYEHRQRQHQVELERWQHSLDLQTKTTVDKIYNVLLFVDGGWLVDSSYTDGPVDEARAQQMLLLRQLWLPSLCLLLHQVLHTTQRYKECIQIADCIASEHHQLYKVFQTSELQNFLKKIRESSIALLDEGLDPLGYPLT